MDDAFITPLLSKDSIYQKLESIDRVLAKLDNHKTPYIAPHLSKDDLTDIFVEARSWLLLQLESLGESDANEENGDSPSVTVDYAYRIKAIRNRIREG